MSRRLLCAALVGSSLLSWSARAAVIVNLDPATAFTTATTSAGGTGGNTNTLQPIPTITQGNGLTVNFTLAPSANDLTGTVLIAEIGGTSNGTGLYLINGVPTLLGKPSAGNATPAPTSLNDTDLSDKTFAVQVGSAPLLPGVSYSLAAVYDTTGQKVQMAYTADGSHFTTNTYTLTNTAGATNWNGNSGVSIAANSLRADGSGPIQGLRGGLSESATSGVFYAGNATDGTGGVKDFAGTISQGAMWNAVGTVVTPEPSTLALAALVTPTLLRRRRNRC